jgi:hypothetical protein
MATDPTISIHALTGIQLRSCSTVQVCVSIVVSMLTTLNSGSMHNFIDS